MKDPAESEVPCAWRARLSDRVLGELASEESSALERHALDCAPCRAELALLWRTAAELDCALGPRAAPPQRLRARLLAALPAAAPEEVQPWKRWGALPARAAREAAPGIATVEAGDDWIETAVGGTRVRRLALDPSARRVTMLVQMDPGSAYPAHRHGGPEECFVLAGDLSFGGQTLAQGDFQRAEAGSVHGVQSTRAGCLLLIVSSTDDELIDAPSGAECP